MAHLQYMPGDPRLVDQLVYELKSKGIFDQFRKECIADVDTRPAYQNLRQRVENSVSTFLSRQTWQPDLNKNQLREKLRKHILDGNYLEQGVERIVDQVVNPKVASVFIPKVEDLVYNYLGIARKKTVTAETSNGKVDDLLPTDLEAVSPGSVKSNDDKNDVMEIDGVPGDSNMDVDEKSANDVKENNITADNTSHEEKAEDIQLPSNEPSTDVDKSNIPLPTEEINPENIPPPENSPPKVELEKIELPKDPIISTDIPLPDDISKDEKDQYFKPINSDDDDSSSDSSLRRNMSPLTPIRNFNNENSSDAQQAFENEIPDKDNDNKEPNSFKFKIDAKCPENSSDVIKAEKKDTEANLSYQFNNQVNIHNFNTQLYEDSSNSNILHIDYESDANSKINQENKLIENDPNSEDSRIKSDRKSDDKKSSHKSSHRSRDSSKHLSSRDKKSDTKQSSSRDSSRHDKSKSSRDENKSKSNDKDKSREKSDKKDSRDSSRHRSSHKSSHKDSKSHRSSSSSHRHSSKHSDEKKSSSSSSNKKDKDKSSDKNSMDKPRDSKSSSRRSDKDRKSSSSSGKSDRSKSKSDEKDKNKKSKKETDDHYSLSGRGNPNRRSTDRDSNDGSTSSKGSTLPSSSKTSESKKESKSSSKSETPTSGDSTSPSDKENIVREHGSKIKESLQHKPIVRIDSHLEQPVTTPPRLPFVPDVTIKKPKFAANLEEAKRLMKMRKFLDEEQKRMNQEAALLLEFQANVRPSLSQVYSSIPGPELEFACVTNAGQNQDFVVQSNENINNITDNIHESHYTSNQLLNVLNDASVEVEKNAINEMQSDSADVEENNDEVVSSENADELNDNNENNNADDNRSKVGNMESECVVSVKDEISNKEQISPVNGNSSTKSFNSHIETAKNRTGLFEVTVIAEELSETEETHNENADSEKSNRNKKEGFESDKISEEPYIGDENKFHYFAEHEKYNAEIERARFGKFLKEYNTRSSISNKIYLINCDSYEENLIREISRNFGEYETVNYHRNGHLKLSKARNVVKNVNISSEISLPIDVDYEPTNYYESFKSHVFSPDKSECSFELSSDYNAKLEEMVSKTSRQEIMEIILGSVIDTSPSKMPKIDYLTDSNIDSECENNLKRKMTDVETTVNNNRHVLTSNKIRKLSTEQISSTTTENEEMSNKNNKIVNSARSKYLGKARRVGLSRPKRSGLLNSPSSDKSVENYEDETQPKTPNGKIKRTQVQRYDTSDLYKPKLHFLSRRNHIT
ncbi:unnamed protein product [Euphydryas editha]|uniref:BOD1/SHG1 domain-containing protein n=1 Tax=Euphydryas editha TaxID=104508 RepID=A0AAU9UIT0_EUPED|nr:unnamed protein product [Euphydryas editha]